MSTYFYARVSTQGQNLDRQLECAKQFHPDRIFADKRSGKDFERVAYQEMKSILQPGDTVILHALDRLGRNKELVKEELQWYQKAGITLKILDVPSTMIDYGDQSWIGDMITNIMVEVIASFAQHEREEMLIRQAEGIAAMPVDETGKKISRKTGRSFGRPSKAVSAQRLPGETVEQACQRLGISRRTWYRRVKECSA